MNYDDVVLLFHTAAPVLQAARLHNVNCSMVRVAKDKRGIVKIIFGEGLEYAIKDLNERGFIVRQCGCIHTSKR